MQRLVDKRTYNKALKNKHNIEKPVISNTKSVQQTLSCFVKKETCVEIITKLATVDGIPVNAITRSEFIRKALIYKGYIACRKKSISSYGVDSFTL